MKHVLTLLAVLALIVVIPGCDVGGSRGPTTDQLAEAQTIEQEFAPLRQEVQALIRQHEGSSEGTVTMAVMDLRSVLESAEAEVEALRSAPRDMWDEYKSAAERAVEVLRMQLEDSKEFL